MGAEADREGDTHDAIMGATYHALCKHGYAHLTMQDIADEFDKSRSLLHYHYDTKEELMLSYVDHSTGWIRRRLEESDTEDPLERLAEFLDGLVIEPGQEERETFALALTELRVQAAHDQRFREKLDAQYEENVNAVADIIADGADEGVLRAVDPHEVGEIMYTSMFGASMYQVTLGASRATLRMREGISQWVGEDLLVVDRTFPAYTGGDFSKND